VQEHTTNVAACLSRSLEHDNPSSLTLYLRDVIAQSGALLYDAYMLHTVMLHDDAEYFLCRVSRAVQVGIGRVGLDLLPYIFDNGGFSTGMGHRPVPPIGFLQQFYECNQFSFAEIYINSVFFESFVNQEWPSPSCFRRA
jgi:hypothetical protein